MYESKVQSPETDRLFQAILTLQSVEECYRFFDDVATIGEIFALAQRFQVAELLEQRVTYAAIAEQTGASTATVSRVSKCLAYGADGYKIALARLKEQDEK